VGEVSYVNRSRNVPAQHQRRARAAHSPARRRNAAGRAKSAEFLGDGDALRAGWACVQVERLAEAPNRPTPK
jgi:hypothetical protein